MALVVLCCVVSGLFFFLFVEFIMELVLLVQVHVKVFTFGRASADARDEMPLAGRIATVLKDRSRSCLRSMT